LSQDLNYVRVSPQKARLVLDLIKGRRVEEALDTLTFTKKGIAPASCISCCVRR
jgi:large subunit ribosomal protein L22